MASGVFNIAKGRGIELHNRVQANDPAAAVLRVVMLRATGLVADTTLRGYTTLAAVLAGGSTEATNSGYTRKVLADIDLPAIIVDNATAVTSADMPDLVYTTVAATGGAWAKMLVCYDGLGTNVNSSIIPVTHHDCVVTPDGTNITVAIDPTGYLRAQ